MGVDCSSNSFAYSVFDGEELVQYGEFSFGKGDAWHRMNNAQRVITGLMNEGVFEGIEKIFIESSVYVNNRKTVILLSNALGAALSPLAKPGVDIIEVHPMLWQNYIGNKTFSKEEKTELANRHPDKKPAWLKEEMRRVRKQRTKDWVYKNYGVIVKSDDLSDAIGVGYWGVRNG